MSIFDSPRFDSPRFLRNVLFGDAAITLAAGAVQLLLARPLAQWMNLPAPLLTGTGLFMLCYAAVVGFVATRDPLPRPIVWLLAVGNFGWVLASAALLAGAWVAPTGVGMAWVLGQAAIVLVLAELQWTGLRRTPALGLA